MNMDRALWLGVCTASPLRGGRLRLVLVYFVRSAGYRFRPGSLGISMDSSLSKSLGYLVRSMDYRFGLVFCAMQWVGIFRVTFGLSNDTNSFCYSRCPSHGIHCFVSLGRVLFAWSTGRRLWLTIVLLNYPLHISIGGVVLLPFGWPYFSTPHPCSSTYCSPATTSRLQSSGFELQLSITTDIWLYRTHCTAIGAGVKPRLRLPFARSMDQ
ncbi:hypothetical protein BDQ17DRAFT_451879 [Cyathus striatus]|nr:hypothetical protein BDQ17DRAFT_451879 [Cyathus striatus]